MLSSYTCENIQFMFAFRIHIQPNKLGLLQEYLVKHTMKMKYKIKFFPKIHDTGMEKNLSS